MEVEQSAAQTYSSVKTQTVVFGKTTVGTAGMCFYFYFLAPHELSLSHKAVYFLSDHFLVSVLVLDGDLAPCRDSGSGLRLIRITWTPLTTATSLCLGRRSVRMCDFTARGCVSALTLFVLLSSLVVPGNASQQKQDFVFILTDLCQINAALQELTVTSATLPDVSNQKSCSGFRG